ncbi:DctP family TRAP transporter solute-binding subunit [Comamonas sp. Y33R10-2]|uniref:DctP family TRAP transporter solute-binding subunit n=1 Tax=Comamonas sp. Y33R10-2 TaxID=2853257 RepID=UPI001C5C8444|nr:DctP family TRAP transporter solute-binding subunit [Comamonas sp. Y33R10-2]QXZ08199.1 DctP family TRAP transporter solute-binding subunit [Comamonas sp. Y33R10-2]
MNRALLKSAETRLRDAALHLLDRCRHSFRARRLTGRYLLVALVPFHVAGVAQAQSTSQLRVADYRAYLPETHSVRQALNSLSMLVNERSSTALQVKVLSGTVPGNPSQQINALQAGEAQTPEIMLVAATGLAELDDSFSLFDLPYALRNSAEVDALIDGSKGEALFKRLEAHGLVGLAWMENGFRVLTTSDQDLVSLQDFHGLKLRSLPVATSVETFKAWGAMPVAIPVSQVREALLSKKIVAQESFITSVQQNKLYEVQNKLWLTNHSYGAQVLVINAKAWSALSTLQQDVLNKAAQQVASQQRIAARKEDAQVLETLKSQGMQIHMVSHELVQKLSDATKNMRENALTDTGLKPRATGCLKGGLCSSALPILALTTVSYSLQ